jgi:hypothetical protein
MTHIRRTAGHRLVEHFDFVVALMVVVGVLVLMVAATAILGWNIAPPSFDIVPDPAGALPY